MDLLRRLVAAVESGASRRAVAERFAVSPSSVIKLMRRWQQTGDTGPGKRGGGRQRKLAGHED